MKKKDIPIAIFLGLLLNGYAIAQMCHGMGGNSGQQHKTAEKKTSDSFYAAVYTCPMHPDVRSDKSGKCPECGMKLEKKRVLMTYTCPEKDCEFQKAHLQKCPVHKKELIKCEVKLFCPKCSNQVDSKDLIQRPVKP